MCAAPQSSQAVKPFRRSRPNSMRLCAAYALHWRHALARPTQTTPRRPASPHRRVTRPWTRPGSCHSSPGWRGRRLGCSRNGPERREAAGLSPRSGPTSGRRSIPFRRGALSARWSGSCVERPPLPNTASCAPMAPCAGSGTRSSQSATSTGTWAGSAASRRTSRGTMGRWSTWSMATGWTPSIVITHKACADNRGRRRRSEASLGA
jgi:hypothetical protein